MNRSIPDAQLDGFVDDLARRIASYQARTIEFSKKTINARAGVPAEADRWASNQSFQVAVRWPETQAAISKLFENGFQAAGRVRAEAGRTHRPHLTLVRDCLLARADEVFE